MQSSEPTPKRPQKRRYTNDYQRPKWQIALFVFVAFALLGIIGFFVAKPAYHHFRTWRIERNAAAAHKALAEGQYDEARLLALSVVRLKRKNYDMLKILEETMEHIGDPNAVLLARILMIHPDHTPDDRINGFKKICARVPMALVFQVWQGTLTSSEQNDTAFLVPFATRLVDQKLFSHAKSLFSRCYEIDAQPTLRLQHARLLRESGDSADLDDAQFEIGDIMSQGGDTAMPAFRMLADLPWDKFRPAYFPELDQWLDNQEDVTVSDRLTALVQRFARLPQYSSDITAEAVRKYSDQSPVEVANWLTRVGQPERALPLLPDDPAKVDIKAYRARADALAALEDWQTLSKWLEGAPPTGLPSLELHARRMIAAEHVGDTAVRTREWEAALRDAGSKTPENGFLELYEWMSDAGLGEFARESIFAAIRLGRGRLPIFQQVADLVPWLRENRRGLALLEFARFMAALEPGNPVPIAIVLDIGCTSGNIDPHTTANSLRMLLERYPKLSGLREALATALLLDDRPDEALAQLPPDAVTRAEPSPYALAITGVAMAMKGKEKESKELLDRVPWNTMLTEECSAFYQLISDTRLAKSAQREKIREFTEAPPPPPDERIFEELKKQEEKRKRILAQFTEIHPQPSDNQIIEKFRKQEEMHQKFLKEFQEKQNRSSKTKPGSTPNQTPKDDQPR